MLMRASCRKPGLVVTAPGADYHSAMSASATSNVYRLRERDGPAGRRILEGTTAGRRELVVIAGFRGAEWPDAIVNPVIEPRGDAAQNTQWRLSTDRGHREFEARAVDRIELRAELYEPLHRPFELGIVDRLSARVLLALLRLPGGARLLRRWHARRSA